MKFDDDDDDDDALGCFVGLCLEGKKDSLKIRQGVNVWREMQRLFGVFCFTNVLVSTISATSSP